MSETLEVPEHVSESSPLSKGVRSVATGSCCDTFIVFVVEVENQERGGSEI